MGNPCCGAPPRADEWQAALHWFKAEVRRANRFARVLCGTVQLMHRRNGCNFFVVKAAATELYAVRAVVEAVIHMVTVGRAKSAVGQYRSRSRVGVVSA